MTVDPDATAPPGGGARLRLRLYVAGGSPNSERARANLREMLAGREGAYDLEVVDVLERPERGLRDGVLVTPMMVKLAPLPERRIIGDLSDRRAVLDALGLEGAP